MCPKTLDILSRTVYLDQHCDWNDEEVDTKFARYRQAARVVTQPIMKSFLLAALLSAIVFSTLAQQKANADIILADKNIARVAIQNDSLRQFERFMQLRRDLAEGRLANLDLRSTEWLGTQIGLGNEYSENSAFSKVSWTPHTIGGAYFTSFFEKTYLAAARIAKEYSVVGQPLRAWKYQVAKQQDGEALGWQKPEYSDAGWKTTDTAVETWYDLGLPDYYGAVWYRQTVKLPKIPDGKKLYLWLAATDGSAKIFVNGKHVPYINAKGETTDFASGYAEPFSFDITSAAKPDAENQITIVGTRLFLNELGSDGLMGPVYLYREK